MKLDGEKTQKSLRFSFLDGIFGSAMVGLTQEYFTPFILALGGTARHVGMLSAFPNLFGSLIQLKSADVTETFRSRRKVINIFVFIQAITLLPMFAMAISGGANPFVFIAVVVLFSAIGAVPGPAWSSMMSDLVEEKKRGEYFGWRNKTLGFIIVAASFSAGACLQLAKRINAFYGFAVIFGAAFLFRLASWYFLTRMYEPHLEYREEHRFSFKDFISGIPKRNFARFTLFTALMNFAVTIASPFFSVLMLNDLHFSYLTYAFLTTTSTLTVYLTIHRWGMHADKVGNLKVIKLTSRLIAVVPALWLLNRGLIYLFFVQIFSGLVWSGYALCTTNFIFDAVTPEKRTRCIAYFNVINGIAICCGSLIGGYLTKVLPPLLGYRILSLVLISSVLRFAVSSAVPSRLKEVKHVEHIESDKLFFSVIGIKPIPGVDRGTMKYY